MVNRLLVLIPILFLNIAANHRTKNYIVNAPTELAAQRIGDWAEYHRSLISNQWFAGKLGASGSLCQVDIKQTDKISGITTYARIAGRNHPHISITFKDDYEHTIHNTLAHEVFHATLYEMIPDQPTRWIDEGMAQTMESTANQTHKTSRMRDILHQKKHFPARSLLRMRTYPDDRDIFYDQSHSFTRFLLHKGGEAKLLRVASQLGRADIDPILSAYGYRSTDEFENEWAAWAISQ